MARVLDCSPAPQVLLQPDHAPQPVTTQSTGQGLSLQPRVSVSSGQMWPPWLACQMTVRERLWLPPPQLTEHCAHADHSDTSQWTGQGPSAHSAISCSVGHAVPPWAAPIDTIRVRRRKATSVPTRQDSEQADHSDQAETSQCTGQYLSLQDLVWCRDSSQALPPCWAGVSIERVRADKPVPQDVEQCPQMLQALSVQSIGHGWTLHARVRSRVSHTLPPKAAGDLTSRVCFCTPPAQELEQAPHTSDQS